MKPLSTMHFLFALTLLLPTQRTCKADEVPKQVKELVATFEGTWKSFRLNEQDEIVRFSTYVDRLTAHMPKIEDGRAFVLYRDEMSAPGATEPSFVIEGKEGYFVNSDGTLGDYFTEQFGQVQRYKNLADGVWVAAIEAHPQELKRLGFANVISGHHVMVKVITTTDSETTHHITRVTTVKWKDRSGKTSEIQFTSLKGSHTKK